MQKIIGLDIGSYSIKAVEILNHFKSYEISQFYEKIIPQSEDLAPEDVVPTCMEELFRENNLTADRILTAMPGQYISSRIVPFGFSDPSKIESAVLSEVEDVVPFNLDEMIIDHQILGEKNGQTITLVVMTKTLFLKAFLSHLQRVRIDPKLVDIDSLSFYNLCPYMPLEPGKCYGLVDVGHEKTSVCLVQDGMLRMFRSINLGGRFITEFLARDLEINFLEAQETKHRVSRILTETDEATDLSPEDRDVADKITVAANSIARELGRTLYAFKTWEKAPIEKIFLSGGTSKIKNFELYLTDYLGTPTEHNRLEQTTLKINPTLTDHLPIMAQGICVGLRAITSSKKHSHINLRKGPFAYVQDYESILKTLGSVFKYISFSLIVLLVSYGVKFYYFNQEIENLQDLYRKEFQTAFPDMKSKLKSNQDFHQLMTDSIRMAKERISSKNKAVDDFISRNKDSGALVALREISSGLPEDVKVNVVEYRYSEQANGSGVVRLRVEADSFDTIFKFKEALGKVKTLKDLVEKSSDSKPGTDIKIAVIETNYTPGL